MPVTVDHAPLGTEELGLRTVGQVLAHLQKGNRLVVNVLIDGREPDLARMSDMKRSVVAQHQVFIETTDPREMARSVLDEVDVQLAEADRIRNEAADLLQRNQNVKAMERLRGCFTTWHHAQKSLLGTAQLLRIDLGSIKVGGRALTDLVAEFTRQLKQIKSALEDRDFVTLGDLLMYETTETTSQWRAALGVLRGLAG